jgi:hypothetical protein
MDFLEANQNFNQQDSDKSDEEMEYEGDLTNEVIKQMYYEFLANRRPTEDLLDDFLDYILEQEYG